MSLDLDVSRFGPEVRSALARAGFLSVPERLELDVVDDELVVTVYGAHSSCEVARIGIHRIRALSPERLLAMFEAALEADYPVAVADQLRAAVREHGMQVEAPPDSDIVTLGVNGEPVVTALRRLLVDGWPEDEL